MLLIVVHHPDGLNPRLYSFSTKRLQPITSFFKDVGYSIFNLLPFSILGRVQIPLVGKQPDRLDHGS